MKNIIVHIIFLAGRAVRFFLPSRRYWKTVTIVAASFVLVGFALSAQGAAADLAETVAEIIARLALLAAQFFMAIAIFFLQFFMQLAGYNGYMEMPIVQLGWVMIRDIANMFFVVA